MRNIEIHFLTLAYIKAVYLRVEEEAKKKNARKLMAKLSS